MDELQSVDLDAYAAGDADGAIGGAVATVRSYCRWHVSPVRESTVKVSGSWGRVTVPTLLMTGLVSIVASDGTEVDVSAATWTLSGLIRWDLPEFTDYPRHGGCEQTFTVTFQHGYDNAPGDLRQVILGLAYRDVDNPTKRQRTQEQDLSDVYAEAGLTRGDREVLDAYALPPLA